MLPSRPEKISDEDLSKGYWFITHRAKFQKIITTLVIVIESLLMLFVIWQLGVFAFFALYRNRDIVEPMRVAAASAQPSMTLQDPRVLEYGAVNHGNGTYDLYLQAQNVYKDWRADFDIVFEVNGVIQQSVHSFLYPNDQKYIIQLGLSATTTPTIGYHIENLEWRRLSAIDIQTIAQRRKLVVSDIHTVDQAGHSVALTPGTRIAFTVANTGVYTLFDFRIPVVAKSGSAVQAVSIVPLFSLNPNEKRTLEAQLDYLISPTEYTIVPDVDVLDPAVVRPGL